MMSKTLFWLSLFAVSYIYLLYPLTIAFLTLVIKRQIKKQPVNPSVSIIISAYNEEKHIKETIKNKLKLDYPKDKLEIIIVSDGSNDRTDEIVRQFNESNVRLLRQEPRQGKTSALNMAVSEAKGEIIVFSDANSIYSSDALRELLANFSDRSVGYVTGKMVYVNQEGSVIGDGCSTYMKYENFLRSLETAIGSIVGVDGGIDAMRKELYTPMRPDQLPDFIMPLKVIEQGYRVVYEPSACLKEYSLSKSGDEYRMRVRVSLRALHALNDMRHLLNPVRYGLFAWQLLSHKVFRYGAFIFLVILYFANLVIAFSNPFYAGAFIAQNLFYGSAIAGRYLEKNGINLKLFYVPFYFSLINFASAHASWKFLHNEKQILWTPRKG